MWEATVIGLAVVVFVFGLTELLRLLWLYLLRPKGDPPRVLVVFLKSGICLQQLRSAQEFADFEGGGCVGGILALDCGLTNAERQQVQQAADCSSCIVFGAGAAGRLFAEYGVKQNRTE